MTAPGKFRNFIGSSFALRRLSDRVCLEHDLSVIANPKLHSKGRYPHSVNGWGEKSKASQKEQIRLCHRHGLDGAPRGLRRFSPAHGNGRAYRSERAGRPFFPGPQKTGALPVPGRGGGGGPGRCRPSLTARLPRKATARRAPAPRRVNLLIDIQERMRQGKGPAYERWAKVYNLKQMAAALQYLKEAPAI